MTVMISIPDREALALEGYRTGALSTGQVAEMLGISIDETKGFLRGHHYAEQPFSLEEHRRDRAVVERLVGL